MASGCAIGTPKTEGPRGERLSVTHTCQVTAQVLNSVSVLFRLSAVLSVSRRCRCRRFWLLLGLLFLVTGLGPLRYIFAPHYSQWTTLRMNTVISMAYDRVWGVGVAGAYPYSSHTMFYKPCRQIDQIKGDNNQEISPIQDVRNCDVELFWQMRGLYWDLHWELCWNPQGAAKNNRRTPPVHLLNPGPTHPPAVLPPPPPHTHTFFGVRFWALLGKGGSKAPHKHFCKKSMSIFFP
jgi:hypothetical protein